MAHKNVPPAISLTTFSCPHCGAYAPQTWWDLRGKSRNDKNGPPGKWGQEDLDRLERDRDIPEESKTKLAETLTRLVRGMMVIEEKGDHTWSTSIYNLHVSSCFACKKLA